MHTQIFYNTFFICYNIFVYFFRKSMSAGKKLVLIDICIFIIFIWIMIYVFPKIWLALIYTIPLHIIHFIYAKKYVKEKEEKKLRYEAGIYAEELEKVRNMNSTNLNK